jgi:DNA excision repair protein ERCC-2
MAAAADCTVAVRELCEFAAKQGDLDLRFTPSPTAEEGVAGHRKVAARRGATHRAEIVVSGTYEELRVRGRVDGFDAARQRLEEVKTYKGDLARMPANHRALHWAQAKVYGWLLCRQLDLASLTVSLVYFETGSEHETALLQECGADELKQVFDTLCARFIGWFRQQAAHRAARDASLRSLKFPHAAFRAGQRSLSENAFRAAQLGRCLMAQAPTGIGKTVGTLFPLLKAAPSQRLDKIFFLSAKGSGTAVALAGIELLRRDRPAMPLRIVELVARDKACVHPDKACHGDSCPLAKGFYDRLAEARHAAVAIDGLTGAALREVALAHRICPYYLGQELARWADVVVGDYNYYFDSGALLHGLTAANSWRVAVLVDEAHNLVDRARAMYSAELKRDSLVELVRSAPASLKAPLAKLKRAWDTLTKAQHEAYQARAEPPQRLVACLREFSAAVTESSMWGGPNESVSPDLLRFHFDALRFCSLSETFGAHSLFDVSIAPPIAASGARVAQASSTLCIRNVVPARFLAPRFAAARTTVLFSATLAPQRFYADTLGLPADTAWLDVEAPFGADQLSVRIVDGISTRYHRRGASLAPIAELIAEQYAAAPGNYLAFFSSFDYLRQAFDAFATRHPEVPAWQQRRGMGEAEREGFLARFTPDGAGIGFAVLGGAFAEGIDLPGTRLIGAFIATLGLPQVNPGQRADEAHHRAGLRVRIRLHLPLSRRPQGRASRGPRHPHADGPGSCLSCRRSLRAAAGPAPAAELVAHRAPARQRDAQVRRGLPITMPCSRHRIQDRWPTGWCARTASCVRSRTAR